MLSIRTLVIGCMLRDLLYDTFLKKALGESVFFFFLFDIQRQCKTHPEAAAAAAAAAASLSLPLNIIWLIPCFH